MTKGHRPGGGAASKNVVRKPVIGGPGARAANVAWASSVGGSRGNRVGGVEGGVGKVLKGIRPRPYDAGPSFDPVPLGNTLVNNVGKGGPGKGREVFRSGSQRGLQS